MIEQPNSWPRFTRGELIMWLVVLGVPLTLLLSLGDRGCGYAPATFRKDDAVNQRSIVMALLDYAADHEGRFPSANSQTTFTTSTEAFQWLINSTEHLDDEYFHVMGNASPNRDRILSPQENGFIYVSGQFDSAPLDAPLIADRMSEPGRYGKTHPFLKDGYAVVGYVGGHSKVEKLNQRRPGATVMGPMGMNDIFQPRPAGLLAVQRENILLP